MAQNKELKEQLAELQEAFIKQTHRNMELATDLESEQIRSSRLEQEKEQAEKSVSEAMEKLEEGRAAERSEETDSLHQSRIQVWWISC